MMFTTLSVATRTVVPLSSPLQLDTIQATVLDSTLCSRGSRHLHELLPAPFQLRLIVQYRLNRKRPALQAQRSYPRVPSSASPLVPQRRQLSYLLYGALSAVASTRNEKKHEGSRR